MKINGFTLIEALIAISVSAVATLGTIEYVSSQNTEAKLNNLSAKTVKIISAIDQRVYVDKYDAALWPAVTDYVTTNQVQEFLSRELISAQSSCGDTASGWNPVIDDDTDTTEVDYKENLKLVPCSVWEGGLIEFGLDAELYIQKDTDTIKKVNLFFTYDNDDDFLDNFLSLKKVLTKVKEIDTPNETGLHSYSFVNMTESDPSLFKITSIECIALKKDCGLMAQYDADGTGVEYLDVLGSNSMINSKIDFKETVDGDVVNTCFTFEYDSSLNVWSKTSNIDCGLGIDPSKGTNYVDADVHSVNADRVHLTKLCSMTISGVAHNVPCGIYLDTISGTETAIAAMDDVHVEEAYIYLLDVNEIYTDTLNVEGALTVNGSTELNELEVNSTSTFNDTVTMLGLNNEVQEDLTVYGSTEIDTLNVSSNALFQNNVQIDGYLDVQNGYIAADHVKLGTISLSELNSNCSIEGAMKMYRNGEHSETVICANYTSLTGTTKTAWKLANARIGQIMPFDGSCPDGFEYFEAAAGRFLVGQNETQLSGLSNSQKNALVASGDAFKDSDGNIITYNIGDTGGSAYHILTEDELPTHHHEVPDIKASCSGTDCAGYAMAQVGAAGSTVWSTANEIATGPSGGGESHENRPPYYTVNYCIYSGD